MTQPPWTTAPPAARLRRTLIPKLIALLGLAGMLVLWVLEFEALTWESGDRVLYLNYIGIGVCIVTTIAAAIWTSWSTSKGGAIVVLVISILINPIWILLIIRAFG